MIQQTFTEAEIEELNYQRYTVYGRKMNSLSSLKLAIYGR